MATLGDVYEVRAEGTYDGIQTVNVFHFRVTGLGSDSATLSGPLATAFLAPTVSIAAKWVACVHTSWALNKITTFNYRAPTDFTEVAGLAVAGTVTGQRLSSFNAWGFRYARSAIGQRYGYKRFAGVGEADIDGSIPTSGALTRLNALAAALPGVTTAGGSVLQAFIAERPLVLGVNPNGQLSFSVGFSRVTTQNSRKS